MSIDFSVGGAVFWHAAELAVARNAIMIKFLISFFLMNVHINLLWF